MKAVGDVAGAWVGRPAPRPGREEELAPPERARYARATERYPLELRPEGTFLHKETTEGDWRWRDGRILLHPRLFLGRTKSEQEQICEEEEREFRFAFVYESWALEPDDERLVTPGEGLVCVVYERPAPEEPGEGAVP